MQILPLVVVRTNYLVGNWNMLEDIIRVSHWFVPSVHPFAGGKPCLIVFRSLVVLLFLSISPM